MLTISSTFITVTTINLTIRFGFLILSHLHFVPIIGTYSLRVSISTYLIFNQPNHKDYLKISLNADI